MSINQINLSNQAHAVGAVGQNRQNQVCNQANQINQNEINQKKKKKQTSNANVNVSQANHVNQLRQKTKCAVLDTNVLMYIYMFKADVISDLKSMGFSKFFVPKGVVEELEILKDKLSGKYSKAAKLALEVLKKEKIEVVELNVYGTDKALIELCKMKDCTLITNDRNLKKKAKEVKIPVGYLREKNRVFVDFG